MNANDLTFGIDYAESQIMRSWSKTMPQELCY
jgi:hypothetical protein